MFCNKVCELLTTGLWSSLGTLVPSIKKNHTGGVMVSRDASSAVDRSCESWSGQTKDCKICVCCFSTKHVAFRNKSKD